MFINLTPHGINLHGRDGNVVAIPASGTVARCATLRTVLDEDAGPEFHHVDIVDVAYGQVTGLPAPGFSCRTCGRPVEMVRPGVWEDCPEDCDDPRVEEDVYIVSGVVLAQCAGRSDVYAPDTGEGAVRDEAGRIQGTYALIRAPSTLRRERP